MGRVIARSAGILLANLVDYAGLFPPAELDMRAAAAEYARARLSPESWMLGRFVVPASRLEELSGTAGGFLGADGHPWRLSVLAGPDVQAAVDAALAWNERLEGQGAADVVELKASTAREVDAALAAVPQALAAYVELPPQADLEPLLAAVAGRGARAKLRTGGVTPQAIPAPEAVARFLMACVEAGVAFKATAGLHHPVRSLRPLTYAANGPRGMMHGFLNVFAAAAIAQDGGSLADVDDVLREEDADAFSFGDDGLSVGARHVPSSRLAAARSGFALGFGSCSFSEPVSDLESLGIL
jgi:hypothetical protein